MHINMFFAGVLMIPCILAARFITVATIITALRPLFSFPRWYSRILTWAGLRGGISVALALSLPCGPERDLLVSITYSVMAFSIIVQGFSVGKLVERYAGSEMHD